MPPTALTNANQSHKRLADPDGRRNTPLKREVLCVWSKSELIEKQARFWVLMSAGSTLQAACDAVGVNRRTGRHWRQATGGQVPRKKPDPSGRYLNLEDRLRIADLHLVGVGVRAIAREMGRSPSTVSRELARNAPAPGARGHRKYAPHAAHKRAELRGRRPKASKFDNPELASWVQAKLCVKWSPEQISDHLAVAFVDRQEMRVSPETIYQALYVQGRGDLRADLHQHLRTGRAVRRPRRPKNNGGSGKIPDLISISERPAEVADRAVPGHWEGDLILGSNCRSAIATLVERQTRFTMLVHLPDGHGAIAVRDGLLATIATLPEHLRKSLTWDQGTELAQHRQITWPPRWPSTSAIRTARGSAEATRTRMGCCASTSRKAPTCRSTAPRNASASPPN